MWRRNHSELTCIFVPEMMAVRHNSRGCFSSLRCSYHRLEMHQQYHTAVKKIALVKQISLAHAAQLKIKR